MEVLSVKTTPSRHVRLWELVCKEGRAPKNWCLQTVVLEKTPESPLDCKEIKPVNLTGNQPWILIERTDDKAENPGFWSPGAKSRLTGEVLDAGKNWGQKEKGASEDEMAGWYHQCNGHELGQTPGDGEGRGGLACCRPWVTRSWTRLGDWPTTGQLYHSYHLGNSKGFRSSVAGTKYTFLIMNHINMIYDNILMHFKVSCRNEYTLTLQWAY